MNRRILIPLGVVAFAAVLAVVVGNRLTTVGALAVALGVAVGVLIGAPVGAAVALIAVRGSIGALAGPQPAGTTSIVLPTEEAEKLIKMLRSRQQASPDAFPLVVDRERQFTAVGGAAIEQDDDQ